METLNIVSLNTRGLGDMAKRRRIFNYYRPKCDILCLQETHSTEEIEKQWISEWGGNIIFSHGESNARGVAILTKKGFKGKLSEAEQDGHGRILCCTLQVESRIMCLMNIYAPNTDSPNFFENWIRKAFKKNSDIIAVGDYNTVSDPILDRNTNTGEIHKRATQMLKELREELFLEDILETAK